MLVMSLFIDVSLQQLRNWFNDYIELHEPGKNSIEFYETCQPVTVILLGDLSGIASEKSIDALYR